MEDLRKNTIMVFKNKHKLIKKIKHFFNTELNEYVVYLDNRRIKKGLVFIRGFELCLDYYVNEPLNKHEVEDLVFKELIKFLVRDIENDG